MTFFPLGMNGQPIKVPPGVIAPTLTAAYPTPARRPLNSRLDTSKLRQSFDGALPNWRVGVDRMLREVLG